MSVIHLNDCPEFTAGDHCLLRETLHPGKQPLALRYSLARAVVPQGKTTVRHRLRSSEVYYIIQGQGRMTIDDQTSEVGPDDTVYIPPMAVQSIANTGLEDLIFICIVDPAWRQEDEDILT